jgi:broad specificity phosphatase PhoE
MPICKVFLIRHGSTVLTAEDRFAGSTDVLLGSDGESQASALGQRLKTKKLSAIYASPMKRTIVSK